VTGKNKTINMCNISGALKLPNKKYHNSDKLKLLALYGAERGKDSFGIWYDDKVLYHVRSTYAVTDGNSCSVFLKYPFPENIQSNIVLMHNRQATVGVVNENAAHPYIIDNEMVGMKNGTIHNYEYLADKYKISEKEYETDSELILKIIHRHGLEVLKEYVGGCAIAWFNLSEPDTLYLWKGASMEYNRYEEERPLFYTFDTNGTLYFNSLEPPLKYVNNTRTPIHSLKENTVFAFKNGKISVVAEFDRSKMSQSKPYNNTVWNGYYEKATNSSKVKHLPSPKLIEPCPQIRAAGNIYYYKGKYWKNGHIVEGVLNIDTDSGEILYDNSGTNLFFYKGWWVKDAFTYNRLNFPGNEDAPDIFDMHHDAVTECIDGFFYRNGSKLNYTFKPKFGYNNYTFLNGSLTAIAANFGPEKTDNTRDALLDAVNYYVFGNYTQCYYSSREVAEAGIKEIDPTIKLKWTTVNQILEALKNSKKAKNEEEIEEQLLLQNWTS